MARNGKIKTTREEYEQAKKTRDRWQVKVRNAAALIDYWEKVETTNRMRIGDNILMSITQDNSGATTIHCESPASEPVAV